MEVAPFTLHLLGGVDKAISLRLVLLEPGSRSRGLALVVSHG